MHRDHDDEAHEHDRGLSYDLPVLARRRMIRLVAGAGLVPLVGCTSDEDTSSATSSSKGTSSSATSSSSAECATIPDETAGPFPGDGSNGVNVLKESGVVRSDITQSFGDSAGGTAEGVPLTITLTVVDAASGCGTPKKGAAVYLWHCDREGDYSLYSEGVTDENYLRGVQESRRQGPGHLQEHLPRLLRGPLAAHPLRGLRQPGRRDGGDLHHQHLAAGVPEGRLRHGVRHGRLQPERDEPEPARPWRRTASSATATTSSWRR